jgi:hypothetical protein
MSALPPNPTLQELEPLVGQWEITVPQFPGPPGRAVIEWLEGGAYLRIHAEATDPAPDGTLIVGRDDTGGDTYTALYYDSRGVSRVYQMSFGDREWKMWREAPGFWQRFSGRLSQDGKTITGAWKQSPDGSSWEHDFDLTYTRVK